MNGAVAKRGKLLSCLSLQAEEILARKFPNCWTPKFTSEFKWKHEFEIFVICLLFALKLKDVELSPVVNRDLSRRVRSVAGAATAKQVIRDDIKLAAKLIRELDKKAALYEKESREETEAREKAEKEAAEVWWDTFLLSFAFDLVYTSNLV